MRDTSVRHRTELAPSAAAANGNGGDQAALVQRVHQRLIQDIDLSALEGKSQDAARSAIEATVRTIVAELGAGLFGEQREAAVRAVIDEVAGLGPIQPLVDDPTISEVMVNAEDEVYVERDGVIYQSPARFRDSEHIMRIIERIISPIGRRVDESSPYVDARLADGSRVNVVIPPLVPRGPTLTIRKFRQDAFTADDLVASGTLTPELVSFLRACVELRLNLVLSGGTGTGKTTLLNVCSTFLPEGERIICIEDPLELRLQQRHVISMEARPPNIEGRNEVTQRDLLRNALRMRPDRIIIGEVRGPEAFDMLQAMNTGHEGSMTTVHANSPRDALARIENMVLMAALDLPSRAIREQMASAIHVVVQIARGGDGHRRVSAVSEVAGPEGPGPENTGTNGDTIPLRDIFTLRETGTDGEGHALTTLLPTGARPSFADAIAAAGIEIDWDREFADTARHDDAAARSDNAAARPGNAAARGFPS